MTRSWLTPLTAVSLILTVAACGGRGSLFSRGKSTQYETIDEGAANGVASTIAAPGETAPPLVQSGPLTNTAADTTSSLTIGTDVPMTTGTSVYDAGGYETSTSYNGAAAPPRYGTTPSAPQTQAPPRQSTIVITRPQQPRSDAQTQPTPGTVAPTTTVDDTSTVAPVTNTNASSEEKPKKEKKHKDEGNENPPSTDTTGTDVPDQSQSGT